MKRPFVVDLIEKIHYEHYDYDIIICPTHTMIE